GQDILLENFIDTLIKFNYKRVVQVVDKGEFAVRGSVLDIFSPYYEYPIRIDLFGDFIEEIKLFHPISQKSIKEVDEVFIIPFFIKPPEKSIEFKELNQIGETKKDINDYLEKELYFFNFYIKKLCNILDYFNESILFIPTSEELSLNLESYEHKIKEFCRKNCIPFIYTFFQKNEIKQYLSHRKKIFFPSLINSKNSDLTKFKLEEEKIISYDDLFWKPEEKIRPIRTLKHYLVKWIKNYNQVIISFKSEQSRNKFIRTLNSVLPRNIFYKFNQNQRGFYALISPTTKGYVLKWENSIVLSSDLLLPSAGYRIKKFSGLKSYDDLEEGDLIVHRDYGVAYFSGLKTLSINNLTGEYLVLLYANDDRLYLPVEKVNLIQKYKGPEGVVPPLDKLGGSRWNKVKAAVKKQVEKIAKDLVQIYAYRKIAKRHSYSPLDEDYYEFEANFGFEETPDQAKAIAEVMADMENSIPMDRLVCGDVGFGKTEVALRAAFRAVKDGHQVCVLCPTTILAEQHFHNFKKRMEPFGIRVEVLSRFVASQRQKKIIQELEQGKINIIIGTHRLLSKDVKIPQLALLILDEEQRFGVQHKEKLKKMRKEIDVLTLTATPIPRTLQLSLSGIRSLSVIETPPPERKPVKTQLLEKDFAALKSILEFELDRKGQVFWVHNRVKGLAAVAEKIKKIVPHAKIEIAHGQMLEKDLEQVMHNFYKKNIDILVCTSIIESGLDFPNANTLIVDNAHLFGLGQLYQLRGRVGRSEKQAFAYFLVPSLKELPPKAKKRLQVILSLDYLGAGFRLAMEDLRLRGAGNILGEAQSGQIGKVGLDLFLEMLDDEIKKLQGKVITQKKEPEIDINLSAYIPQNYILDKKERLRYYRLLAKNEDNSFDEVLREIKDKYGFFPKEFQNFIEVMKLKQEARKIGISKLSIKNNYYMIKWEAEDFQFDVKKVLAWVEKNNAQLLPSGEIKIYHNKEKCFDSSKIINDFSLIIKNLQENLLCVK
ncbi:transcription-repair coupling factor, partial [Desulfonauticus submarinus]